MTPERFKILLAGFYAGTLSAEEKRELADILNATERGQELQNLFTESLGDPELENLALPQTLGMVYDRILLENAIEEEEPVRHEIKRWNGRWVAAAAVIGLLL